MATFSLTGGNDLFNGTAGADTIEGLRWQLQAGDTINGGGGFDILRLTDTTMGFTGLLLQPIAGVERIDMPNASGAVTIHLDAAAVTQSDTDTLELVLNGNPLTLNTADVGLAGTVVVNSAGLITLFSGGQQRVTIADRVNGKVLGNPNGDVITGGSGNDSLNGAKGDDFLNGQGGHDTLIGDDGSDVILTGAGDDVATGGAGSDRLTAGAGRDALTGGTGSDVFGVNVAAGVASFTTITDYQEANPLEYIDLRGLPAATALQSLSVRDVGGDAQVSVGSHTVLVKAATAASLGADDFLFAGDPTPTTFTIAAGTNQAVIQQVIDEAPAGSIIQLAKGNFTFTSSLEIDRSDITLRGAGEGNTIIHSNIPNASAAPTIRVTNSGPTKDLGGLATSAVQGATSITMDSVADIKVGDVIRISQANTNAWLIQSGNGHLINYSPELTPAQIAFIKSQVANSPLREAVVKVTGIKGNAVTLSHALPFAFAASEASIQKLNPSSGVTLEGFTIETNLGEPVSTNFNNTLPSWVGTGTVHVEETIDSTIRNIRVINSGSNAFNFNQVFGLTGDSLTAIGSHNKGGEGNGYGFNLLEAFNNTFTNLTAIDMRHSVLFSSFHAEHYNNIHVSFTNRDINFHGGPDSGNTIVVDRMEQYYVVPGLLWPAVGPGSAIQHPNATIDANDVTFKFLRATLLDETVTAHASGGDLATEGGYDRLIGGAGNDTLNGGSETDFLFVGRGRDVVTGGSGYDQYVVANSPGGVTVITDFDAVSPHERIDLRKIAAATGMAALSMAQDSLGTTVTVGNQTIVLRGVQKAELAANDFIFVGQQPTHMPDFFLTIDADNYLGTAGDDVIEGTVSKLTQNDTVRGGAGVDALRLIDPTVAFSKVLTDKLQGIERIELLDLSGPASVGIDQNAVLQSDTDILTIFSGSNPLTLAASGIVRGRLVIEGSGLVTLHPFGDQRVVIANGFNGNVDGNGRQDSITGGTGHDKFSGNGGHDTLTGNGGNDTLNGGDGNDVIAPGIGTDMVTGGAGYDQFKIAANGGADRTNITDFDVAALHERIDLSAIAGITGMQKLTMTQGRTGTTITFGTKSIFLAGAQKTSLTADDFVFSGEAPTALPSLYVTVGNDTFAGTAAAEVIEGPVAGLSSGDRLNGGGGIDSVRITNTVPTIGPTQLALLNGFERIEMIGATGNVGVRLGAQSALQSDNDVLTIHHGSQPLSLDTSAVGTKGTVMVEGTGLVTLHFLGDQRVTVANGFNGKVQANGRNDTISGGSGSDSLNGGGGNDRLFGSWGGDSLDGGAGNDTIQGAFGRDILTGGLGADNFVFATISDSGLDDPTRDRITDFAAGDRIDLSIIDAKAAVAGNQAFVLDKNGIGVAGEIKQSVLGGNLVVQLFTDADAAPEMTFTVVGRTALLAAADFIL